MWVTLGTFAGTAPDGTVRADEPDLHVASAPQRSADVVYAGTADALDGWLWHRHDHDSVSIEGDAAAREHVAKVLGQPLD